MTSDPGSFLVRCPYNRAVGGQRHALATTVTVLRHGPLTMEVQRDDERP